MVWFTGEVADAVREVKQQSNTLLVFVKGSDEISAFVESQFNDEAHGALSDITCLQIGKESQAAVQFFAVYPVKQTPCIYLIGSSGQIIDVKVGRVETGEIVEWVRTRSPGHTNAVSRGGNSASTDVTKLSNGNITPSGSSASDTNMQSPLSERLDYAQQLVEVRRRQKLEEAQQKSKEDELKRRHLGKSLNEFKEQQRLREISDALAQRQKDELEDRKLRERLRKQIEEDRRILEERNALLYQNSTNPCQPSTSAAQASQLWQSQPSHSSCDLNVVTLQMRLLDGSGQNFLCHLPKQTTVNPDLRNWLKQLADNDLELENVPKNLTAETKQRITNIVNGGYQFRLLRPPKTLKSEEELQTLEQLGLCPASALFMVPVGRNEAVIRSSVATGIVSQLINVLNGCLNMVYNLVSWTFNNISSIGRGFIGITNPNYPSTDDNSTTSGNNGSHSTRKRSSAVRRQGNMARLSHMPDESDDEQARWNGNSTEQL